MINIKNKEEISVMKEGGAILGEILRKLESEARVGMSTADLNELAEELIYSHGAEPSFLGYDGFPASLCVSLNDEIVHGVPSEDRILNDGDILKLDLGIKYKGFHVDSALTKLIGNNDTDKQKLINVTKESLNIGIAKARVGNTVGDLGAAIQEYVELAGYSVVRELIGHGIGRDLHEEPEVPNYGEKGDGPELKAGMIIAIEPMVVTGDWNIEEGEDGFVFKTADGGLAAHFEHTVAITEKGPIILTK